MTNETILALPYGSVIRGERGELLMVIGVIATSMVPNMFLHAMVLKGDDDPTGWGSYSPAYPKGRVVNIYSRWDYVVVAGTAA